MIEHELITTHQPPIFSSPYTEPWASTPDFDTSTSANMAALRSLFLETIYNATGTYNIAGYLSVASG